MSRTYQTNDYDLEDEDAVRDGDSLRVPLMLMDADQRAVHQHFNVNDHVQNELNAMSSMAGYRPGCVQDIASSRQAVKDASYDLHSRTGTFLPEATAARDAAYAATEQRQQWKRDASQTLGTGYQQTLDPPYAMQNLSSQGNAQRLYSWTPEQLAVLKQAQEILGITFAETSYAPFEDLHARLIGLGPVGSQNRDDPGSISRTGDTAARDAAFEALCKRSESAWKTAGVR
jgi:hypothetical protein